MQTSATACWKLFSYPCLHQSWSWHHSIWPEIAMDIWERVQTYKKQWNLAGYHAGTTILAWTLKLHELLSKPSCRGGYRHLSFRCYLLQFLQHLCGSLTHQARWYYNLLPACSLVQVPDDKTNSGPMYLEMAWLVSLRVSLAVSTGEIHSSQSVCIGFIPILFISWILWLL